MRSKRANVGALVSTASSACQKVRVYARTVGSALGHNRARLHYIVLEIVSQACKGLLDSRSDIVFGS